MLSLACPSRPLPPDAPYCCPTCRHSRPSILQLPGPTQLALLLAYERCKGQQSFYWPYIQVRGAMQAAG